MIFDSMKNKENYKHFPLLYEALCFLDGLPQAELPLENTVLIENRLFCNPVTFTSKPEHECVYEAHRKFIDLHYIVEGVERIATSDVASLLATVPYSPEKDIAFFEGDADGYYDLKPGQFMVCFPNDAHKVAMMKDSPVTVRKAVVKIIAEAENEI